MEVEATLAVTSEENGLIDQRSHYYASIFDPDSAPLNQDDEDDSPQDHAEGNGDDDMDDTPNSQDFFPPPGGTNKDTAAPTMTPRMTLKQMTANLQGPGK
jgi:hypothetical protein